VTTVPLGALYAVRVPIWLNTDGKADEPIGYSGTQTPPHEVGAGESVTRRIGLFNDHDVRGCLPTGIYPFEITHLVRPAGEAEDGGPKEADTTRGRSSLVFAAMMDPPSVSRRPVLTDGRYFSGDVLHRQRESVRVSAG
jgi:hypothetical protein